MSKEKNTTTSSKGQMPKVLKTALPVIISLVLIIVITIVVTNVKSATHRSPQISNGDDVYVTLGDLKITNDRLYTYLKQSYGSAELQRLIDNKLYETEINAVDVNSDAFIKYIYKSIFSVEELDAKENETYQKTWDTLIDSLIENNLLTKADANSDTTFNSSKTTSTATTDLAKATSSKAWTVVKSYYKMQYARNEWAKKSYLEHYQASRTEAEKEGLFDDKDIASYYDTNYTGSVTGFYIPFTSEESAYAMMKKYGINVDTNYVLTSSSKGWVSKDFNAKNDILAASDYLSQKQVIDAFIAMYNEVLGYYQDGDIITTNDYTETFSAIKTVYAAQTALKTVMDDNDNISTNIVLPTTIAVTGKETVNVTWTMEDSAYATFDSTTNKITIDPSGAYEEITVNATLVYANQEDSKKTTSFTLNITKSASNETDTTLAVDAINPVSDYELTSEFLAKEFEYSKFTWTKEDTDAVNSTLSTYLSATSTQLTLNDDPSLFYKSYTRKPVAMGNYYVLAIKITEEKPLDFYTVDDDDNYTFATTEEAKAIYDDIIAKKTEELYTDNNLNDEIYKNRFNHDLKIYDPYLQAIYEYNYKYFYETTLSSTDYDAFKVTKKTKKNIVATYKIDKTTYTITADDLWNELVTKYGVTQALSLINVYEVVGNEAYNTVYNPYTGEVYDKDTYKSLLTSEIASLRKNFELGYFTYSYLSYYGFIPNFPAKYGWSNFIKDYFGAYSDEELMASNGFGGTVYSDALELFTKEVYDNNGSPLYWDTLNENFDKYYSVTAHNIVVGVDYNYDGTPDTNEMIDEEGNREECNWTPEQRALAVELANFLFDHANETGEQTLSSQLTAIVALYNKADMYYGTEAEYDQEVADAKAAGKSIYEFNYFAKYKKANLVVTFEATQSYDTSKSLVQEFVDEMLKGWKQVKDYDLLDATLDSPLVTDAFETSYGYHMVSILSTVSAKDKPTQQDIDIYVANKAVTDAKTTLDSTQKSLDEAVGSNKTTYEAQLKLNKATYDEKIAALVEVLKKYNVVESNFDYSKDGYTIDEDITTRVEAWYTTAYETLTNSKELNKKLVALTKQYVTENKVTFSDSKNLDLFNTVLEIMEKDANEEEK